MHKTYILDTSVLIHDPQAIHKFKEHNLILSITTIEELDRLKSETSERGYGARAAIREIYEVLESKQMAEPNLALLHPKTRATLKIITKVPTTKEQILPLKPYPWILHPTDADNAILRDGLVYANSHPATQLILVSKDANMRLKALAIGIPAEDFRNDQIDPKHDLITQTREILVTNHEMQKFCSRKNPNLDWDDHLILPEKLTEGLHLNQYVLLAEETGKSTVPARYVGHGRFSLLYAPSQINIPNGICIKPKNLQQIFAFDALFNPKVKLITFTGGAGSGKTILPLAYGLAGLFGTINRSFKKVVLCRPILTGDQDLGFLPGSKNEKLAPWMAPAYDSVEVLTEKNQTATKNKTKTDQGNSTQTPQKGNRMPQAKRKTIDILLESGQLEIEGLAFMKGRSLANTLIICDEAQDAAPSIIKKVVTRTATGSKVILAGDPTQIENPYLNELSNGLSVTAAKMRGWHGHAHVHFTETQRDELVAAAIERL
jgi:PhoH-like ATPase